MSKRKLALTINIAIVLLELIAFGRNIFVDHGIAVEYYTNDSNIIALISSLLFIILYKKDNELTKDLRFIATSCLTVTFLVVIFILCPMYNFNYKLLMFTDNFFIFHTVVPILSIISYIAFEERSSKDYLCLAVTIIYAIALVILNAIGIVEGPYPFLMIRNQSIITTLLWGTTLLVGSYIIGITLNRLNEKINKTK